MAWRIFAAILISVLPLGIHHPKQAYGIDNQGSTIPNTLYENTDINANERTPLSTYAVHNTLYLSASIFEANYEQMLPNFKIFIYPRKHHDFGSPEWCSNRTFRDLDKPVTLFYESLVNSAFTTDDPEEAHLFFMPFSIDALRITSVTRTSRFLRRYIDGLRAEYPYWNRTLGADHFYVSCEGIDIDSSRNVVELKKNAIQVSCYPLPVSGNLRFYPHKDINMPPIDSAAPGHKILNFEPNRRQSQTILAYCVSWPEAFPDLESTLSLWKTDPGFLLDPLVVEPSLYVQRLSSSRFCLNFIGGGGNPLFLIDAMTFGCIPVIISSSPFFDLPFQDVLNWKEFLVIVNTRQVSKLKQLLQSIPEARSQKMKNLAKEASRHLKWHSTPRPYDAFYSIMYQLWLRRHTIRYAQEL